ncbi:unnamed protein product [Allacma fusca]|uniref:MSP domain-containing protein n=1 Tax=Allacma fusca TaxID=39272 RepID=A0A8J2KQE4_9HEXA|nr:unnamed protein product [Allacma fusca]
MLQLPGIDEPGVADDHLFRTAQTPSPRTTFAEPVRRMNMDSHDGPHLVEVTDRIVLTKDNAERISGRFQIRNVAPSNEAVLFKIKTTAPEKFHVRPTLGLLEASATGNVSISVNLGSNLRSIGHERFQVQVVIAPKDLLDGLNGNGQGVDGSSEFHGDLSRVWKKIASKETRIENHRIGCTLDSSISEAMISPSGANLVTMNEDEMRKGLKQIETRIVDSIQNEMVKKFTRIERLVYFALGLLVLLLASNFWSSSSNSEQYCHKKRKRYCRCRHIWKVRKNQHINSYSSDVTQGGFLTLMNDRCLKRYIPLAEISTQNVIQKTVRQIEDLVSKT